MRNIEQKNKNNTIDLILDSSTIGGNKAIIGKKPLKILNKKENNFNENEVIESIIDKMNSSGKLKRLE